MKLADKKINLVSLIKHHGIAAHMLLFCKTIVYSMLILFCIFVLMIAVSYKTTEKPRKDCVLVSGIVTRIYEGGVKDAVFELQNDKISYYINRGLENGLTLKELRNDLIGKKVAIYFSSGWTPFAPFGTTCTHIREIEADGNIVYTEFETLPADKNIIPKPD